MTPPDRHPRLDPRPVYPGAGTCKAYCGAWGKFSGFDFIPAASKRPIIYMARLKGSAEYKGAIEDWKAGKAE